MTGNAKKRTQKNIAHNQLSRELERLRGIYTTIERFPFRMVTLKPDQIRSCLNLNLGLKNLKDKKLSLENSLGPWICWKISLVAVVNVLHPSGP